MKRLRSVTAAVLAAGAAAAGTAAAVPGTAMASTAPGWSRTFQSGDSGLFQSLAAINKSDVWAAATLFQGSKTIYKPYVLRFNGSTWTTVTIPGASLSTTTVQASSASDVWVFGLTQNKQNIAADGAYRWNGSSWRKIPVPAYTYLQGTDVLSSSNVWAFGGSGTLAGDVFHWNGSTWKAYTLPNDIVPQAISASAPNDVWVAGYNPEDKSEAIAYRWNGSRWAEVSTPHPEVNYGGPGITVITANNVWMGWDTATATVAEHWNGHTWTKLTAPGDVEANSTDIAPDGRGGFWFGPFADWTGKSWISTLGVSPSYSSGGFGPVASIPGTSSALMAAGVENTGSTVEHPTLYRLTFG